MIQTNDAAGGAGSISEGLLGIALNGLSRAVDGIAAKKFPLTSFNENLVYGADGNLYPAGAPQATVGAVTTARGLLNNPVVIGVGVAVAISLVMFLALRK